MSRTATPDAALAPSRYDLSNLFCETRAATDRLCAPLSAEDQGVQSMPDASPTKWHRAHTSWFFETFILSPFIDEYQAFDPAYTYLFNSYYEQVGTRHPRPARGMITRPDADHVSAYRRAVDTRLIELIAEADEALWHRIAPLIELGCHHEQQHQELILTDILHAFSLNPTGPAYQARRPRAVAPSAPLDWIEAPGGIVEIGHEGAGFAFDNEGPRHQTLLRPFQLASRPVTQGEWQDFIADDGYRRPEFWLSDGWTTVRDQGWQAPLYWQREGDGWWCMTLAGFEPINPHAPVSHLSFYEADAYASWAGARLPREAEWEHLATACPVEGNFVETGALRPLSAGGGNRPGDPPRQLFGDVWEWTADAYRPYPGYRPPAGAVGEYNGKFMCNQFVLRGGSCVSPQSHLRATYRNFFYPHQRWQFAGLRLARDL